MLSGTSIWFGRDVLLLTMDGGELRRTGILGLRSASRELLRVLWVGRDSVGRLY